MVAYVSYEAGVDKGDIEAGHVFNDPFHLGEVGSANYTGATVVETVAENAKVKWMQNGKFGAFGKLTDSADEEPAFHEGYVLKAGNTKLTAIANVVAGNEVSYVYDNIIIPQEKLPTLKAEIKSIPLLAKARRIAVYYSQIAAFQAKTDYGFDLGDQLAEKAVGQLSYKKLLVA